MGGINSISQSINQGSSSDRCCLFSFRHGPINVRLSFPTLTIDGVGMKLACAMQKISEAKALLLYYY